MAEKDVSELSRRAPQGRLAPFHEMERMERIFDDFFRRPFSLLSPAQLFRRSQDWEEFAAPSIDVFEENQNVVVKAEVPGIKKEDINVTFSENTITISGEKKKEEKVDNKDYYRLERSFGTFSRSFHLPAEVDSEKASATFKDGVLEVRIPKTESSKQKIKKINIQ